MFCPFCGNEETKVIDSRLVAEGSQIKRRRECTHCGKNVKTTESDLKNIFPIEEWNKLHIQIIMYARAYCPARGCYGLECEICKTCYPKRKSKFKHKKP